MISALRYSHAHMQTAPRQEAAQGNVCLRCCFHVKFAKKLGARSGFHNGIKRSGAAILRKAVVRITWLIARENALNTKT